MSRVPSILLLGSRSDFSAIVLSHLARAGLGRLRAAIMSSAGAERPGVDTRAPGLAVSIPDPLSRAAEATGTPLDTLDEIGDLGRRAGSFDLLVTACFPRRLPPTIVNSARTSCLNLHPSLLPAYRGPSPLFWQLRAGESAGGVSIHKLSEQLDAGDIVAAEPLTLSAHASAKEINRALVEAGARLLIETLRRCDWRALPGTVQDPAKASYFSWPAPGDFHISRQWPAERAFRFMRGTLDWGHPYAVDVDGARLLLQRALSWDARGRLPGAWVRHGDTARIAFNPGVLHAVVGEVHLRPGGKAHPATGRA